MNTTNNKDKLFSFDWKKETTQLSVFLFVIIVIIFISGKRTHTHIFEQLHYRQSRQEKRKSTQNKKRNIKYILSINSAITISASHLFCFVSPWIFGVFYRYYCRCSLLWLWWWWWWTLNCPRTNKRSVHFCFFKHIFWLPVKWRPSHFHVCILNSGERDRWDAVNFVVTFPVLLELCDQEENIGHFSEKDPLVMWCARTFAENHTQSAKVIIIVLQPYSHTSSWLMIDCCGLLWIL